MEVSLSVFFFFFLYNPKLLSLKLAKTLKMPAVHHVFQICIYKVINVHVN